MELIKDIHKEATKLNACELFTGKEDYKAIVKLLKSIQGMEFCLKNNFPKLEVFQKFAPFNPSKDGVFIDAGVVKVKNVPIVYLIGNTHAKVIFDTANTENRVVLMHGATAQIEKHEKTAKVVVFGAEKQITKK